MASLVRCSTRRGRHPRERGKPLQPLIMRVSEPHVASCRVLSDISSLLVSFQTYCDDFYIGGISLPIPSPKGLPTNRLSMANTPTPEQMQQLLEGPSLAPPPGVIPNFANPANFHTEYVVTVALCLSLSTTVLCMRMYTKFYIIRKTVWADCRCPPR